MQKGIRKIVLSSIFHLYIESEFIDMIYLITIEKLVVLLNFRSQAKLFPSILDNDNNNTLDFFNYISLDYLNPTYN